jgi:hypothetical protein
MVAIDIAGLVGQLKGAMQSLARWGCRSGVHGRVIAAAPRRWGQALGYVNN